MLYFTSLHFIITNATSNTTEFLFYISASCSSDIEPSPVKPKQKLDFVARGLEDFAATGEEEISFQEGDELVVQPSIPAPSGFWMVRLDGKGEGYAPRNLVSNPPGLAVARELPPRAGVLEDAQMTLVLPNSRPFHLDKIKMVNGSSGLPCHQATLERAEVSWAEPGVWHELDWKMAAVLENGKVSPTEGVYGNEPMRFSTKWKLTGFKSEDMLPCSFKLALVHGVTAFSVPPSHPDYELLQPHASYRRREKSMPCKDEECLFKDKDSELQAIASQGFNLQMPLSFKGR